MKTKIYNTFLFICLLFLSSCLGLDIEPRMAIDPETLGQNEVQQLLTGTYQSLQNDPGRDTWVLFDMRGENLIHTYLSGPNDFVNNNIPSTNGVLLTMWRGYYRVINRANLTLNTLSKLKKTESNLNIEAQTRFLRAYAYYCLATRWDGVPLLKENTLDRVKRDRQSVVFQFVKEELEYCVNSGNLNSFQTLSGTPFFVSKEAAMALLARLSLTMEDMTTAGNLAEALINSEVFTLSDNFDNIFTSSTNSEIIFSLRNSTSEGAVNLFALFTTYDSPIRGSWFLCPSPESEQMFDNDNDLRKATSITYLASSSGDYVIMNKFRDYAPLIVARIAEMYLISAEAQGLNGINRLNELRVKRGLEPLQISSIDVYEQAVALERRKELYSEGFYFFDLVRTGKVQEKINSMSGRTDYYLPLPASEVTYNSDLLEYN